MFSKFFFSNNSFRTIISYFSSFKQKFSIDERPTWIKYKQSYKTIKQQFNNNKNKYKINQIIIKQMKKTKQLLINNYNTILQILNNIKIKTIKNIDNIKVFIFPNSSLENSFNVYGHTYNKFVDFHKFCNEKMEYNTSKGYNDFFYAFLNSFYYKKFFLFFSPHLLFKFFDALLVANLNLILIKFYCYFFEIMIPWYISITILIIFTVISYTFNWILGIRQEIRDIIRIGLGKFSYDLRTLELITATKDEIKDYNEYIYDYYGPFLYYFYHKGFKGIVRNIIKIFITIQHINNTYKLQFICIYYISLILIIFNKLFIIAVIISLILSISKLIFYIMDYNYYFFSLGLAIYVDEKLEKEMDLSLTINNINFLYCYIFRYLQYEYYEKLINQKDQIERNLLYILSSSYNLNLNDIKSIIKMKPKQKISFIYLMPIFIYSGIGVGEESFKAIVNNSPAFFSQISGHGQFVIIKNMTGVSEYAQNLLNTKPMLNYSKENLKNLASAFKNSIGDVYMRNISTKNIHNSISLLSPFDVSSKYILYKHGYILPKINVFNWMNFIVYKANHPDTPSIITKLSSDFLFEDDTSLYIDLSKQQQINQEVINGFTTLILTLRGVVLDPLLIHNLIYCLTEYPSIENLKKTQNAFEELLNLLNTQEIKIKFNNSEKFKTVERSCIFLSNYFKEYNFKLNEFQFVSLSDEQRTIALKTNQNLAQYKIISNTEINNYIKDAHTGFIKRDTFDQNCNLIRDTSNVSIVSTIKVKVSINRSNGLQNDID